MSDQDPEVIRSTKTMLVVRWSEKVEGLRDKIDSLLCRVIYK